MFQGAREETIRKGGRFGKLTEFDPNREMIDPGSFANVFQYLSSSCTWEEAGLGPDLQKVAFSLIEKPDSEMIN